MRIRNQLLLITNCYVAVEEDVIIKVRFDLWLGEIWNELRKPVLAHIACQFRSWTILEDDPSWGIYIWLYWRMHSRSRQRSLGSANCFSGRSGKADFQRARLLGPTCGQGGNPSAKNLYFTIGKFKPVGEKTLLGLSLAICSWKKSWNKKVAVNGLVNTSNSSDKRYSSGDFLTPYSVSSLR